MTRTKTFEPFLFVLSATFSLRCYEAATFNATKYSKDYSCYHAYGWAENDGYYNPYFSAYTNIVASKYGLSTVTSSVFDKYEQEFHR
jgi:hypothetical protein